MTRPIPEGTRYLNMVVDIDLLDGMNEQAQNERRTQRETREQAFRDYLGRRKHVPDAVWVAAEDRAKREDKDVWEIVAEALKIRQIHN